MTYYMYFIQTLVIWCTINEIQPLERSVTLIWPLKVIQGQRSQGQLKDHIWLRICICICTENNLYNQSTPLKFDNSTRITSEKPYEAIHLGSTSILINIEKYVKMSQTRPFCPWQWPLEWFNQILLLTVHHHHSGEASCQNREKVNEQIFNKWTISVKIGEKWQI